MFQIKVVGLNGTSFQVNYPFFVQWEVFEKIDKNFDLSIFQGWATVGLT
jgi:hypothetical protein